MKIGLDFGTTYSKIAYLDEQQKPVLFQYGGASEYAHRIPTEVAYQTLDGVRLPFLGWGARSEVVHDPSVTYCQNFKMLLPLTDPDQWRQQGWNADLSPAEVIADYLEGILRGRHGGFEDQHGAITGIVLSVPEVWQRSAANTGADLLQQIVEERLGFPLDHLRSEPVCAAAYYAYKSQEIERASQRKQRFKGNLLVCDVGGGTFDVALCQMDGDEITVLDFDGDGQQGLGSAGVAFDQRVVSGALARLAPEGIPHPGSQDFRQAMREFEEEKLKAHNNVAARLEMLRRHPSRLKMLDDQVLYTVRGQNVNYPQVVEAFGPIREGIEIVLTRLQARAEQKGRSIDRIAIVGGFGQSPFVRDAVLSKLGIEDEHDKRFSRILNDIESVRAIAAGAALIANGKVKAMEYFPHTVEMKMARQVNGALSEQEFFPIVSGGEIAAGRKFTTFLKEGNGDGLQPVRVASRGASPLPVYMRLNGNGERYSINLPFDEWPEIGRYFVGLEVSRSNLGVLVFRPLEGGQDWRRSLGSLDYSLIAEYGK